MKGRTRCFRLQTTTRLPGWYSGTSALTRRDLAAEDIEKRDHSPVGTRDGTSTEPWIQKSRTFRDVRTRGVGYSRRGRGLLADRESLVSIQPWYIDISTFTDLLLVVLEQTGVLTARKLPAVFQGIQNFRRGEKKITSSSTNSRLSHSVFQKHRPFSGSSGTLKAVLDSNVYQSFTG